MEYLIKIATFLGLGIVLLFIISLISFYFYRRRQLDKVKIIKFINDKNETFSTYNIHQSIFKNKKVSYVIGLLKELDREKIINQIQMGNSEENALWEYIDK